MHSDAVVYTPQNFSREIRTPLSLCKLGRASRALQLEPGIRASEGPAARVQEPAGALWEGDMRELRAPLQVVTDDESACTITGGACVRVHMVTL